MLLGMILYIFGILFSQACRTHLDESDEETLRGYKETAALQKYFSTLPRSCYTCFMAVLGGIDWEIAAAALSDLGAFYVFMFIAFVTFVYLAVLNVISGLFIHHAIEEAEA